VIKTHIRAFQQFLLYLGGIGLGTAVVWKSIQPGRPGTPLINCKAIMRAYLAARSNAHSANHDQKQARSASLSGSDAAQEKRR
jgi:hypothetical protein